MGRPTREDLVEMAGEVPTRPGAPGDAVSGLIPDLVVTPGSAQEVSAVLRASSQRGWSVVVRGGGTKLTWGAPPRHCEIVLETGRLDQLVEHEPGDLICVAGAGMTLGRLQSLVAGAAGYRQRLMLDPPQGDGATLGGLVATRAAGPLRARYGTMRDQLLGAQFVLADGTIARTGGKVVKNVAGYDIDKLLVGSLGTLAVLVEVAVRLHPVADSSRTVLLEPLSPSEAGSFCAALRRAPAVPSLVEVLWPERAVLVRIESSPEGAERQAERVVALHPRARVLDEPEARLWEQRVEGRPWGGSGPVVGISVPLSAISALLELAEREAASGALLELSVRGTIGVGEARLVADPQAVSRTREGVEKLGGQMELHRSGAEVGRLGSASQDPVARRLMKAVKTALDPGDILAPGRWDWEA
ncbi:MAG: FAD-binding oxidoreductase [Candidatus Dormibacteraeota bacterium]|nr:FAD-binding oxidoreductase [Candidatus Dormibacteraeota bacterium]